MEDDECECNCVCSRQNTKVILMVDETWFDFFFFYVEHRYSYYYISALSSLWNVTFVMVKHLSQNTNDFNLNCFELKQIDTLLEFQTKPQELDNKLIRLFYRRAPLCG